MKNIVNEYFADKIDILNKKRIEIITQLNLSNLIDNINSYTFQINSSGFVSEIVKDLVDAHLSSSEETIFGDWLEGLAIFVNQKVFGGWKSGIPNIDLEFDKDSTRYIVTIKSGPNWGNSSQIKKMKSDFITAKKTLRTSNSKLTIEAINGCCTGTDNKPDKGEYFKYCGQEFWTFISGNDNLYLDIIEPLGKNAKGRNEEFQKQYIQTINLLTKQFIDDFCAENGEVDWHKIVKLNSAKKEINK